MKYCCYDWCCRNSSSKHLKKKISKNRKIKKKDQKVVLCRILTNEILIEHNLW